MENVPREKLLICNVKEGWGVCGPLCNFLDLPVPDIPFPRLNENRECQKLINILVVNS